MRRLHWSCGLLALLLLLVACRSAARIPTPGRPAEEPPSAEVLLSKTATIWVSEERQGFLSTPVFKITDPLVVKEMVSLLVQAEPVTSIEGLRTTHTLDLYEEGGEEKAAAVATVVAATPPSLRALGELPPGMIASIRYDFSSNRFYYYAPYSGTFAGFFAAPPAFKELFAAEHERRGREVWTPEPRPTPAW